VTTSRIVLLIAITFFAAPMRAVVLPPRPLTTRMRIAVASPDPVCGIHPYPPVRMHDHTIDLSFPVRDPCFAITTPPPNGTWEYYGYLPSGTWVARRILISPEGAATVAQTLTFEVVEAGAPLHIPTLGDATRAMLAILLASLGAIAIKRRV
jgi:hypothetical protein